MLYEFYFQPKTIREALELLNRYDGQARILAGGTDLIIDLKAQRKTAKALVDISQIPHLDEIRVVQENVALGTLVTHTQAFRSDVIRRWAPALSEACSVIGSPQIRNMGTLVGNIVNAMPAADAASALIVLEATAKVISCNSQERTVPVEQLYAGPGNSVVDSTREIVTELTFPITGNESGSSFQRLSRRKALALPILNAAVSVVLDKDRRVFQKVRVVVGPVSPLPFRSKKAETLLMGFPVSKTRIEAAALAASEEAAPRTSIRGGQEYRKEMVRVLVERGLYQALKRIHADLPGL